jgi:hypothetical protein
VGSVGQTSALQLRRELTIIRTSKKRRVVQSLGTMYSRIAALQVRAKAPFVLAVLGLSVLSSSLVMTLALLSSTVTGLQGERPA